MAVGPSLDARGRRARSTRAGMIALPGIIDAHTCLWQTVLRGYVPDLWQGTYNTKLLPLRARYTPDDNFNAAYVGALRDAVLRHHDRRRLLPQHQLARLRAALARGAEDDRHPAPVRIFVHDLPAGHLPAGGPVRRRAAHLRPLSRSRRHHDHRLRHRIRSAAPDLDDAARVRARARGAELHPRQRGRHDRQAERGRPARARPVGDPRQPDQQSRARD